MISGDNFNAADPGFVVKVLLAPLCRVKELLLLLGDDRTERCSGLYT